MKAKRYLPSMNNRFCFLFVFYFFIFPSGAFSQHPIDSLLQVIKTAKEDTGKANTLNLLSKQYYLAGEYDQSRKYSNEALLLSEKINYQPGMATAYLFGGVPYFYEGNYAEALKKYTIALSISEKINNRKVIADCYNNLGLVNTYQHRYSEAAKLHQAALKIRIEIGDSTGIGRSYNNLGIIDEEQGNYTEAIKNYFESLKIAEALEDTKAIADAFFNIGNVYGYQKSYLEALKNYSPALSLYQKTGFKQGVALCMVNEGLAYQELDSLQVALKYCQQGYDLLQEIGNKASAAQTKNVIAHIQTRLGNYPRAMDDFSSALTLFIETGDTFNISTSYRGIGELFFYKGQYQEALKNFRSGLALAKSIGFKENMVYFYGAMAEVYEKMSDYKNAYAFHKLYFSMNDSLLNQTRSKQIAEIQTRFETEKKDREIALLNKDKEVRETENKKQKLMTYSIIGGLGLMIIVLLFGYRAYRSSQMLRLADIRNRIASDLHDDIGSTLNSISIYSEVARKKDQQQDEALEMIGDASRKIIDAMSDIVWTINPDNDNFEKIIFRMKSLAYNLFRAKKMEYTFHSDEMLTEKKLSLEARRNFYLIFKEAINNIVKYSGASSVDIKLLNENEQIRLTIRDNGVGFDMAQENVGNGLKNMHRRAAEMNAVFKMESGLGSGTHIELIWKA